MKFDIIIGNPPFQNLKEGNKKSQHIWDRFVLNSLKYLNNNGYLLFIHPSNWRSPNPDKNFKIIFNEFMKRDLIYLNMNDFNKGRKIFGVGSNFDYYILKNTNSINNYTIINDIDNKEYKINLNEWNFIPNGKLNLFKKLLASKRQEKVNILYNRSLYGTDKNNMNEKKTSNYKYPCCYSITQKDGIKFYYSNIIKGHFGIPKVIFSNGSGTYPIIDKEGKYGLTQFCYAIIDDKTKLIKIKETLETKEFIDLMKYVKYTDNKYNYKVISLFKKDFYN